MTLTELKTGLAKHAPSKWEELKTDINKILSGNTMADFLKQCVEKRFAEGLVCPHCGKKSIFKFGKAHGKQRYRCKDCGII